MQYCKTHHSWGDNPLAYFETVIIVLLTSGRTLYLLHWRRFLPLSPQHFFPCAYHHANDVLKDPINASNTPSYVTTIIQTNQPLYMNFF